MTGVAKVMVSTVNNFFNVHHDLAEIAKILGNKYAKLLALLLKSYQFYNFNHLAS